MALVIEVKTGERIIVNGAEIVVQRRVDLAFHNDSHIELPDRGRTIARRAPVSDVKVLP